MESLPAFALTVAPILLAPGTSTLLVSAEALRPEHPRVAGIITGDLTANTGQMAVVGCLLALFGRLQPGISLDHLRWVGVAYLVLLAGRRLLGSTAGSSSVPEGARATGFVRGFLVSATNPKALVFFAGLFPAFLEPGEPLVAQIVVLGAIYLSLDGLCLAAYALAAGRIRHRYRGDTRSRLDRIAGTMLLAAAVILATR